MTKNLDHELNGGYKDFEELIKWMRSLHKEIALNNGEKELLCSALKNPTIDIQEKNKAVQLLYQTKKQEVMSVNIFEQFNTLSRNIGTSATALIESNKKLSESNDKNQKTMNNLTKRIMIAAIIQAIAATVGLIITFSK